MATRRLLSTFLALTVLASLATGHSRPYQQFTVERAQPVDTRIHDGRTKQHHFQDFTAVCAQRVSLAYHRTHNKNASGPAIHESPPQLVGKGGMRNKNIKLKEAWGVTVRDCFKRCADIPIKFKFAKFATSMFNWLLPWVILIAQLPYETSGPFNNVLSVLLAVGSPAFITYGLIITLSNRFRVTESFQSLYDVANDHKVSKHHPRLLDRLDGARYLLSESQQSPMRAYDENGWLANLLFGEDNWPWWQNVKKDLRNTRRKPTLSMVIQLLYAFTAWLFTVIVAFGQLGDVVIGLSISSSSIWSWMFPVVIGWVAVGTQVRPRSIPDALASHAYQVRTAEDGPDRDRGDPDTARQMGITARSGINPHAAVPEIESRLAQPPPINDDTERQSLYATPSGSNSATNVGTSDPIELYNLDSRPNQALNKIFPFGGAVPTRWSFSLAGDEAKEGPVYNYARVFTFSHFAATVEQGFRKGLTNIHQGQDTDPTRLSQFVGYDRPLTAYPEWTEVSSKVWRSIAVAGIVALFVQWGTSGPSIMLDYLTPVTGLGCRSLSHLIYAVTATFVFFSLLVASMLSHELMLRYQREPSKPVPGGFTIVAFITLRSLGTLAASINALWIIVASVLELSGVYDRCWCNALFLTYGYDGWVLLFRDAPSAGNYWIGAVVFTSVVCFLASIFIWLGCKRCNQRFE